MRLHRGEIWRVKFDPQVGAEIGKTRPAVIVSRDGAGRLPLKIVVPITEWKAAYAHMPWFVRFEPGGALGLSKESAADCFQVKSVSEERFEARLGTVPEPAMAQILSGIAMCLGIFRSIA